MDVTTTGIGKGRTAEAVRSRSRDLYELLLDRIQERVESANTFTLSELAQVANVAGRIGLGGEETRDSAIVIRIVRDQPVIEAQARILLPPASNEVANHVDNPVTVDAPSGYVTDDEYAQRVEAMTRPLGEA